MTKKTRTILIILSITILSSLVAAGLVFTSAKYRLNPETQTFDVKTVDFEIETLASSRVMVYNPSLPSTAIQYTFKNYKAETPDKFSAKEIRYQISIHSGNADDQVNWTSENSDFSFTVNDEACENDLSPVYVMQPDVKVDQTAGLRFTWEKQEDMAHSEFIFVQIKVLSPYEKTYQYKITVLSKAKILIEPFNKTDSFGNGITRLSFMTSHTFGASLPTHKMKLDLQWNQYVDIDDTNGWIRASIADPLNADSIVNGGANRHFVVYLEPSAFVQLNFYKNTPGETRGNIKASVEIMYADKPYYDLWDIAKFNESGGYFGWSKYPDSDIAIP